jgi:multiple sugar transport system substrate-binding protein
MTFPFIRRPATRLRLPLFLALLLAAAGCNPGNGGGTSTGGGKTGGAAGLEFWHTRTGAQQKALEQIVSEFNAQSGGPPIVPVYVRNYSDVRQKVLGALQAHRPPLLAVCYETHVQAYAALDAVRPLDDYINDPKEGLSQADLADIFPQYLETNRFANFGNKLLSFPFTKSLLVLAYNQTLLQKTGQQKPPQTWDEFTAAARSARAATNQTPFPLVLDASTLDGIIFSFSGSPLAPDGKSSLFDQPPTVKMLTLLRDLTAQKLATETDGPKIAGLFGTGNVLFLLGTSSARSDMEQQVGDKFPWDVAVIPHAPEVKPVTVLYGPNVCLFKSTPANELLGWRFIKFFTTTAMTARWSMATGYLPVRKSAADLPDMKAFFQKNPRAQHAFDLLPLARVEPNVPNYEEVRTMLGDAATRVIHGQGTPEEVARQLKQKADGALGAKP